LLVGVVAATPTRVGHPLRRLANVGADRATPNSPDPLPAAPVDSAALRRAAKIITGGDVYLNTSNPDRQLAAHDLPGAARLFLLPALLISDPAKADWILSYDASKPVPAGIVPHRVWRVAPHVAVVEVRR
jgi:hypothetical protein